MLDALERLETISHVVNATQQLQPPSEDEFHLFGLSVAAQLRKLPLHSAVQTQAKIQSLLSNVRLQLMFSHSPMSMSSSDYNSSTDNLATDLSDVSGIMTPNFLITTLEIPEPSTENQQQDSQSPGDLVDTSQHAQQSVDQSSNN